MPDMLLSDSTTYHAEKITELQVLSAEFDRAILELEGNNTDYYDKLKKNLSKIQEQSNIEWPGTDTWDILMRNPPLDPGILIDGILSRRDVMSISAPSKGHKTFFGIHLAWAMSMGHEWMGFRTTKCKVLYINCELSRYQFYRRLDKIVSSCGDTDKSNPNFFVQTLRGVQVNLELMVTKVRSLMVEHGIDFVIIDPLYKLLNSSVKERLDENSNSDMEYMFGQLNLIQSDGGTLGIISHYAKGSRAQLSSHDRMAGAGVQGREPDTLVTIDKLKSESKNAFQLEFTLRNFAPIEPIPVSWEYPIYKPDNDLQGLKIEGGKSRPETVSTDDVLLEWNNLRGDGYTVTKKLLAEQLACGPRTIELKIKELKKKNCLYNLRLDGKGNVVGEVPDLSNMIAPDPATLPTQENLLRNMGGL